MAGGIIADKRITLTAMAALACSEGIENNNGIAVATSERASFHEFAFTNFFWVEAHP